MRLQLEWGTLLEQTRANHAHACANHEQAHASQAVAEATLLAMRRCQAEWLCQDDELYAWFSDAHGVVEVAKELARSQGGINEELGRHQAHDKAGKQMCHGVLAATRVDESSWVCTPPQARVGKALHECEVYDIGEDNAQNCGGFGVLGGPATKREASITVMCERPCDLIEKTSKDDDCVLSEMVDVGIDVDAMVSALPRPPEGDNVSSGVGVSIKVVNDSKTEQKLGKTGEAADAGALGVPSATAGQSSQLGPVDGGHVQHGLGAAVALASDAQAYDVEATEARTTEAKANVVEENAVEAKAAEAKAAEAKVTQPK